MGCIVNSYQFKNAGVYCDLATQISQHAMAMEVYTIVSYKA